MELFFQPFDAKLRHVFTVAAMSRTHTPLVLVQVSCAGVQGEGEASMPPYLGESQDSVCRFLKKVVESNILKKVNTESVDILSVMKKIDALEPNNTAAKAAIDIALHDWKAKMLEQTVWQMFDSNPQNMPVTSCTLGMDTPPVLRQKVSEASDFKVLKIKLGAATGLKTDKISVETIVSVTEKPLYVDANAGWKDKEAALDFIFFLKEMGVQLVEQPMGKHDLASHEWLSARSPLPIFADESFQRYHDLDDVRHAFHGINIKLMKCCGLAEANLILKKSRKENLKIMLGCMTETSCAILAAAQLAPQCDFVDLDGPWLIANNPYATPELKDGKIQLTQQHGLGLVRLK
ncbi:MAG: hypothetical protein RL757_2015 [Bacteroidota bacterium]|jgi:L-alanine-DL-glutamate epimerase-like enolase superfamily enzyme